ncbi:MAG: hypothetical protein U5Q44_16420 [Dehalococcoidia bacterium]|nr:hypothetical protein [Dehalococcoidia bacterium]
MGDGSTAPRHPEAESNDPAQDSPPADPGLRLVPAPRPRHALLHAHRRLVIHALVVILALAGAVIASRSADQGAAVDQVAMPGFTYSGVAGAVEWSAAANTYLGGGSSVRTLPSIAALENEDRAPGPGQTFTGAVGPMTSVSAGVSAAAVDTGEQGSGVTGLADSVDPTEPFAIWVTRPGDSLADRRTLRCRD